MNRRRFLGIALAAVGSLPLLSRLAPAAPATIKRKMRSFQAIDIPELIIADRRFTGWGRVGDWAIKRFDKNGTWTSTEALLSRQVVGHYADYDIDFVTNNPLVVLRINGESVIFRAPRAIDHVISRKAYRGTLRLGDRIVLISHDSRVSAHFLDG